MITIIGGYRLGYRTTVSFLLQVYTKLSVFKMLFNDMYSLKIHQLLIYSFVARKQSLSDQLYY